MPIENLKISQVGMYIKLQWDFPNRLSDDKTNLEIEKITRLDVYYSDKVLAGEKFLKKSTLLRKLEKTELSKFLEFPSPADSTISPSLYSLEIPFKIQDLNVKNHFFGLRYHYGKKKSPLGNIAALVTQTPVKPIDDLQITRENKIIKLKWSKPQVDLSGLPIANIIGYKISRRIISPKVGEIISKTMEEPFQKINANTILSEYYADGDTGKDGEYQYYVSTIISNDIESGPSAVVSVTVSDIYPPEIPSNLVSFKGNDHIFLTWKAVGDSDLAYYRIYRKSMENDEFTLLADQVSGNQYKDKDVKKGMPFFYVVSSVDQKKNESQYSNIVKEEF
ncbi:MAG: hypothetical protein MUF15_22620 [Acidobacteria bacterium]|nr:hypothetical protein [Acidobacteriota bacterium]